MRLACGKALLLHGVVAAGVWIMQQHVIMPPTMMQVIIPLQVTMREGLHPPTFEKHQVIKEKGTTPPAVKKTTISPKKHTPRIKQSSPMAVASQQKKSVADSRVVTPVSHTKKHAVDEARLARQGKEEKQDDAAVRVSPSFHASYLHNPAPLYPAIAKRQGMQGRVLLQVKVSAQGKATMIGVHRSSGYIMLDESAKKAVWKWRFVPAKTGSKHVAGEVIVPVMFVL